jgi:hypothetical protein
MNRDETVVLRTYDGEALASIAAARLESEGIDSIIQKDDVGGAYPPLQMSGGVRLLIKPEDQPKAEQILSEIEAEDSEPVERPEPQEDRKKWKSGLIFLIGGLLLGFILGYLSAPEPTHRRGNYTGVIQEDRNKQGKPGRFYYYADGLRTRIEEDRNYDGKPDAWSKFVADRARTATLDNNFDGEPDAWITYKDEFNYTVKMDTDFDGKPDATIYVVNGLKQRVDWHPNDSPIIERRQIFEHDVFKEELVDTDLDGIFDLKITYDRYERPIAKAKCWIPN